MTQANQPPAPVAMNRPINIDNTSIELSWLPSQENDFANYRVYRSEQASVSLNSPPVWMNSNKSMNKFKDTGLKPGKTYYYKVVVYDKGGLFAESNEIAVNK
jgi:fibronectin type 3 domain-containing protein